MIPNPQDRVSEKCEALSHKIMLGQIDRVGDYSGSSYPTPAGLDVLDLEDLVAARAPGAFTSMASPTSLPISARAIGEEMDMLPRLHVGLLIADDLVRSFSPRCPRR